MKILLFSENLVFVLFHFSLNKIYICLAITS